MNLTSMLVEVRQGLQQVGSFRNRGFEDGELVAILNKVQDRYIRSLLQPREDGTYEISTLDMQKIRTLFVADYQPKCYRTDATYAVLPGDMDYLLGKSALVSCDSSSQTVAVRFAEIAFVISSGGPGTYYAAQVIINGVTIVDIPALYEYNDVTALTETVDAIFHRLRARGYEVYLDQFGNNPVNSQVFTTERRLYVKIGAADVITASIDGTAQSITYVNFSSIAASGSTNKVPLEIYDHLIVHDALESPYYKPHSSKCVATFVGRELKVYGPDSSIVVSVLLNYIRKPQQMNLILSRDCELPDGTARELCDLTVEYIRNKVQPEQYAADLKDNQTRTTIK